jgi:hypothetical protein
MKCLLALTTAVVALAGQSALATTPQLSISSVTVNRGTEATVDLSISGLGGGTALGTFDVNVAFNPAIVNFAAAKYGDPILGDQLDLEGFGTVTTTTPGSGTVELFELSFDSPAVLASKQASAFILAALSFDTVGAGTSSLSLSVNSLGDQNGNALTASLRTGSITVAGSGVPEPGTLGLIFMALLVFGTYRLPSPFGRT